MKPNTMNTTWAENGRILAPRHRVLVIDDVPAVPGLRDRLEQLTGGNVPSAAQEDLAPVYARSQAPPDNPSQER
jgi:hypothetical protein